MIIVIRLVGGLGNQMFQYAAGVALAKHFNVRLLFETSFYRRPPRLATPRQFQLGNFGINISVTNPLLYLSTTGQFYNQRLKPIGKLISKYISGYKRVLWLKDRVCGFNTEFFNEGNQKYDIIYADGYWQSEKYFQNISDDIRNSFLSKFAINSLSTEPLLKEVETSNSVSIHIRRGDYISHVSAQKTHGTCPLEYYHTAAEHLTKKWGKCTFYIFSDDRAWVQENLHVPGDAVFVKTSSDINDLLLMSKCRHHIIANSSFSWWGAWLNPREDKVVIAPKQWFLDTSVCDKDIVPETWIRL